MKKENIIFDYDGVIVDSKEACFEAVLQTSEKMKLGIPEDICRLSKTKEDFRRILTDFGGDITVGDKIFHESFHETHINLFPGIKEILKEMNKKFHIVLFTDRSYNSVVESILYHEIHHFFEEVVTYSCTNVCKPNPAGIQLASQRMNININDFSLYLGDSNVDFFAAQKAGISFLGVDSGVNSKDDWNKLEATSIPSAFHLPEYLKKTGK